MRTGDMWDAWDDAVEGRLPLDAADWPRDGTSPCRALPESPMTQPHRHPCWYGAAPARGAADLRGVDTAGTHTRAPPSAYCTTSRSRAAITSLPKIT